MKKLRIKMELEVLEKDLEEISQKCGLHGITVKELLENFIRDLTWSDARNGSDECERVNSWFERCWFGMFPEETFLKYLIESGQAEDFSETYEHWLACVKTREWSTENGYEVSQDELEEEKWLDDHIKELYQAYTEEFPDDAEEYEEAIERALEWTREDIDLKYESKVVHDEE